VTTGQRFQIFFAVWVALGVTTALVMWRAPPRTNKRWFDRLAVLAGVLFLAFSYWLTPVAGMLYFLVPAVALVILANLTISKFCPNCGAYYQNLGPLYRSNYCRKCGLDLRGETAGTPPAPSNNRWRGP
jgi:hypothetical protein